MLVSKQNDEMKEVQYRLRSVRRRHVYWTRLRWVRCHRAAPIGDIVDQHPSAMYPSAVHR